MHTDSISMHTDRNFPSIHTGIFKIPIYKLVLPVCILIVVFVFQNTNYNSMHTVITSIHTGNTNIKANTLKTKLLYTWPYIKIISALRVGFNSQ